MASLGQQLKQAREERGITIKQIADATRLGSRFLQAIENDDYKTLPGGVFNRAFVRKFARQVGMDEEQAVRLYDQQLAEMGGEPVKVSYIGLSDEAESKSSGNSVFLTLIVLIVLGAAGGAAWLAFNPYGEQATTNTAPTTEVTATPVATANPTATPTPEPAEISGLQVQLIANLAACWVSFRTDGGRNQEASLKLGESREFLANEKITFTTVGNLPALNIMINGKRASLEKLAPGLKGQVASNVVITKDNYRGFVE